MKGLLTGVWAVLRESSEGFHNTRAGNSVELLLPGRLRDSEGSSVAEERSHLAPWLVRGNQA